MKSSRHSGNNVDCSRSTPATKRFINPPANRAGIISRRITSTSVFSHSQGQTRTCGVRQRSVRFTLLTDIGECVRQDRSPGSEPFANRHAAVRKCSAQKRRSATKRSYFLGSKHPPDLGDDLGQLLREGAMLGCGFGKIQQFLFDEIIEGRFKSVTISDRASCLALLIPDFRAACGGPPCNCSVISAHRRFRLPPDVSWPT